MAEPTWLPYPPCASSICMSSECCGLGKYQTIWPGLLGKAAEEARAVILKGNPHVGVVVVPKDGGITDDFCCNRVWVFVDENNRVRRVPKVG
ncbi:hypothetical protein ABFX02_03G053600 [Erythranthe guttata]